VWSQPYIKLISPPNTHVNFLVSHSHLREALKDHPLL
jgi:hypothetical protein